MERFLKSLLVAIFAAVVAFTPAHADDPCRNLLEKGPLDTANTTTNDFFKLNAGTYTFKTVFNGAPENLKFRYYVHIRDLDGNIPASNPITANGGYWSGGRWQHAANMGNIGSLTLTFILANDSYVSFGIGNYDSPVTIDNFTQAQLERGNTATSYVPYNPLCATCDGTVVNYETVAAADVPAGVQNGTPSPTNPIEPVFYKQGDMVLRRIGDYADSYNATTGKITRRIGVKVLNGNEPWVSAGSGTSSDYMVAMTKSQFAADLDANANYTQFLCSHLKMSGSDAQNTFTITTTLYGIRLGLNTDIVVNVEQKVANVRAWLAQQYDAGTPVTVYYPLPESKWYTEDWAASYCHHPIKIATTAYNSARFSPVVTELNDTIATIRDVVTNTINQTKAIADLQATKQTRPDSECPAGKKCLLVEDVNGVPHWYEIIEEYIPPE